jgi:hypothetical protein
MANHPKNIIMFTCDAFGVLPPIARLTREQAMYHFLAGYTVKVAGTETGVTEHQATSGGAGEQAEVCVGSRNRGTQRIAHAGRDLPPRGVSVADFQAEALVAFLFMAGGIEGLR